jgi:glutamyl-tRNA synthetase
MAHDVDLLTRAMPVLKVRAKDINELAASAGFLFATRPLTLDAKAQSLLTDERARCSARSTTCWPSRRNGRLNRWKAP